MAVYTAPSPEPVIKSLLGTLWRPRSGKLCFVTPTRIVAGGLVDFCTPQGERHMRVEDFYAAYEPYDPGLHASPWDWIVED